MSDYREAHLYRGALGHWEVALYKKNTIIIIIIILQKGHVCSVFVFL